MKNEQAVPNRYRLVAQNSGTENFVRDAERNSDGEVTYGNRNGIAKPVS